MLLFGMGAATGTLLRALLGHVLGGDPFPQPSLKLALFESEPIDGDDFSAEVTGGNYARQDISFTISDTAAAVDERITFPLLPACTVTHWGLVTTDDEILLIGAFEAPKTFTGEMDAVVRFQELVISAS